jgi:uncharacterized membrane protein YtjA (UPF0391 family)
MNLYPRAKYGLADLSGIPAYLKMQQQASRKHKFVPIKRDCMLKWSATFFIIAIVAAIFGFTGIAEGAASVAKVLFGIFLALCVLMLILGATIFKK